MIPYTHKARLFGDWLEQTCGHYGYLIGTRGQTCTPELIQKAYNNFIAYRAAITACANKWLTGNPDKDASDDEDEKAWKVTDCEGWEECYRMGGGIGNPLSDSEMTNPDVNTGKMYALAINGGLKHGTMADLPKDCPYPIAVGHTGHVTFYHKGFIWQAQGHCYGTTKSLLTDRINADLKYWYQMPYYDYEDYLPFKQEEETTVVICKRGDDDSKTGLKNVTALQTAGLKLGYPLKGDDGTIYTKPTGYYGSATNNLVEAMQKAYALSISGDIFDDKTNAMMTLELTKIEQGVPQEDYDKVVEDLATANQTITQLTNDLNQCEADNTKLKVENDEMYSDLTTLSFNAKETETILLKYPK